MVETIGALLTRSLPVESPANVVSVLDDESRLYHAEDEFLDNLPMLYTWPETAVPSHIKAATENLVFELMWEAVNLRKSLRDTLEETTESRASVSCAHLLHQFVGSIR